MDRLFVLKIYMYEAYIFQVVEEGLHVALCVEIMIMEGLKLIIALIPFLGCKEVKASSLAFYRHALVVTTTALIHISSLAPFS